MSQASRHDAWQAGDSYDLYMGRWSRQVAPRFLDWLDPADKLAWLEVGFGTGALSAAILDRCNPASLISVDPSEGFLTRARAKLADKHVEFRVGDAQALAVDTGSRDMIVSGLVLNFVPDKEKALAEMKRVARGGATIAFYVWDYPGGGVEFMRAFWTATTSFEPNAQDLGEGKRFPFCTPRWTDQLGDSGQLDRGGLYSDRDTDSVQGLRGLLASVHPRPSICGCFANARIQAKAIAAKIAQQSR